MLHIVYRSNIGGGVVNPSEQKPGKFVVTGKGEKKWGKRKYRKKKGERKNHPGKEREPEPRLEKKGPGC